MAAGRGAAVAIRGSTAVSSPSRSILNLAVEPLSSRAMRVSTEAAPFTSSACADTSTLVAATRLRRPTPRFGGCWRWPGRCGGFVVGLFRHLRDGVSDRASRRAGRLGRGGRASRANDAPGVGPRPSERQNRGLRLQALLRLRHSGRKPSGAFSGTPALPTSRTRHFWRSSLATTLG